MVPPPGLLSLRRWQRFGLIMALWTVLGVIDAGQFYVHANYFKTRSLGWEEALASGLADWYVWALIAPVIYRLGRRYPLDHAHWRRRLPLHLAAGTAIMFAKVAIDLVLAWRIHGQDALLGPRMYDPKLQNVLLFFLESYKLYVTVKFFHYLLIYAIIVGVSHAVDYYHKYREREWQAAQLDARLAETRLQVLRMQLQPHFLFNTLNAVAALMHKDVRLADRMIARLGELLRATLADPGTHEVALRRELAFLKPYLEIEQARIGPRLTVHSRIVPGVLDARVPYLLLQPLVENAIRHGIAPRPGPGKLEVHARRRGQWLELEVSDNGVGLPPSGSFVEGIGLSNTRARLRGLYGDSGELILRRGPLGGLTVTVRLPYRPDEAPAAGPRGPAALPPSDLIAEEVGG